MKNQNIYFSLLIIISCYLNGMEGPMNAEWFYNPNNPYQTANTHLQQRKWEQAEQKYLQLLEQNIGSEYDRNMARINLASCQMAQGKASPHWAAFDKVCGIPKENRFNPKEPTDTLVVRTDMVGIGDIAHFLKVIPEYKKRELAQNVVLAARRFMHKPLEHPAAKYGFKLIDEKEAGTIPGKVTHLIALFGHLQLKPELLSPENVLFTPTESAVNKVGELINPAITQGTMLVPVFLGENRQATLIGGKQLPRDPEKHGRNLTATAFALLLRTKPAVILDCNSSQSRINFNQEEPSHLTMPVEFKQKILSLPKEETPFDTTIALGFILSQLKDKFVGFGADNGPTNMFTSSLSREAQNRFAFIIPNGDEYDMRMEGEGESYTQMISSCRVYRCATPNEQNKVIAKAYNEITETNEPGYCTIL